MGGVKQNDANFRVGKRPPWVKAFANKSDAGLIPGDHMVQGEK